MTSVPWGRHAALVVNHRFLGVPELAEAVKMLAAEKFAKMIAFLKSPACRRVRTNNHVERVNRKLRHEEKSRYKWRTRRTTVRFLVLLTGPVLEARASDPESLVGRGPGGRAERHGIEASQKASRRMKQHQMPVGFSEKSHRKGVFRVPRIVPRSCRKRLPWEGLGVAHGTSIGFVIRRISPPPHTHSRAFSYAIPRSDS